AEIGGQQWTVEVHWRCDAHPPRLVRGNAGLEPIARRAVADQLFELAGRGGCTEIAELWCTLRARLWLVRTVTLGELRAIAAHARPHRVANVLLPASPNRSVTVGASQPIIVTGILDIGFLFRTSNPGAWFYPVSICSRFRWIVRRKQIENARIDRY